MSSAKLLTGLDTLEKGGTFAFHVLGEAYAYQVDKISVVLPNQFGNLAIEDGKDYAIVITCTPYGANTHRLLVRGHCIAYPAKPDTTDYDTPVRMLTISIASVSVAVLVIGILIVRWFAVHRRCPPYANHSAGQFVVRDRQ